MISFGCPMGPKICLGEVKPCSNPIHRVWGKGSSSLSTCCDQLSLLAQLNEIFFATAYNHSDFSQQCKYTENIEDCCCNEHHWKTDFSLSPGKKLPLYTSYGLSIRIMSQGEGDKFWSNDKSNISKDDQKPAIPSIPEFSEVEQTENDSGHNNNHYGRNTVDVVDPEMPESTTQEEQNSFLYLGPVGKKRRVCRNRSISEKSDDGFATPSPCSTPTTPTPPIIDHRSSSPASTFEKSLPLSMLSPKSSENTRTIARGLPAFPIDIKAARKFTSHEDQPLNLCLGTSSSSLLGQLSPGGTSFIGSSSGIGSGLLSKTSVLDLVGASLKPDPFTHDADRDLSTVVTTPLSSPPLSLSGRSDRESEGESQHSLVYGVLSPTSSVSMSMSPSSTTQEYNSGRTKFSNAPSSFISSGGSGSGSPSKRKLQCPDCGKEFSQLRNYRYHRSRHEGTSQFACTCPICGKSFNDKGYLSSHLKIHRNAKEYQCEWCEKSFNQRVAYNMHVRIHTGHKPHKCHLCPKAFSRKMLLRQHLRTHTGERPYTCDICGKAFADRSNMLLHQRLHSGQRPYKCDICGKSFSKNHHLKTHLNHHAGIKPYQCEKCKATFSQSSNMKTHFRKCSGSLSSSANVSTNPLVSSLSPGGSSNPAFTGQSALSTISSTAVSPGCFVSDLLHPSIAHHSSTFSPVAQLSSLAQQIPTLTPEQASSFSALLHSQLRSSSSTATATAAASSSSFSPTSSSAAAVAVANFPMGLVNLRSPPLIAGSPEKFGSSKGYYTSTRSHPLSEGHHTTMSKVSQKQQQSQHQQQSPSLIQFTTLESSPQVLAPSPLSPASSLLLLNPNKHLSSSSSSSQHHHHHHPTPFLQHHSGRIIQHTSPSSAAASTISEILESVNQPVYPHHTQLHPLSVIQHHQQHHIQQQQQRQQQQQDFLSHSPSASSSLQSLGGHLSLSSSSQGHSPQSRSLSISSSSSPGNLAFNLHPPIDPASSLSQHQQQLLQHVSSIPVAVQPQKQHKFNLIPRNVTITSIPNTSRSSHRTVVPQQAQQSQQQQDLAEYQHGTSMSSSTPWSDTEELKHKIKEEQITPSAKSNLF